MGKSFDPSRFLFLAMAVGLVFHGSMLFFTFSQTYDGFVHMFFADHYARDWFDNWDYRWYTGFTVTSYPPLVHQIIALLSLVVGLKAGFILWACAVVILFIRGVYVFSKLYVSSEVSAVATALAVVCPSFVEALHIFGQLPSLTGISFLLNATPEVYRWIRTGKWKFFFGGIILLAITSSAHHVSTIFGMVFFILPVMGTAVIDLTKEVDSEVRWGSFFRQTIKVFPRVVAFGLSTIITVVIMVLPYWLWSRSDPISQVPIPHGSRDNFLEVTSSGLVFFLIPWGILLLCLPYIFRAVISKRNIFLGLALFLGFLLGTGGTTPLPRMMLGDTAFDILTLDRFTFWATLLSMPFWALFVHDLLFGQMRKRIESYLGNWGPIAIQGIYGSVLVLSVILTVNLSFFRPLQPDPIDVKPITQFLSRDGHDDWRYLTLGFGDQMAWLSANSTAKTVDGNYHSVRRLPEFTSRAVERLENSKYRGVEGLGALQDFLGRPNTYNLKYIFSNDKFYEPLLFFTGWNRVQQLENGIVVWERPNVRPLPHILFKKTIPAYQRYMWGLLPLMAVLTGLLFFRLRKKEEDKPIMPSILHVRYIIHFSWGIVFSMVFIAYILYSFNQDQTHSSPNNLIRDYYDALDFKYFDKAYTCFDPETRPLEQQYTLDLSLEDGILNSYAKLSSVSILNKAETRSGFVAEVQLDWITSLQKYSTRKKHTLVNRNGKWFIEYPRFDRNVIPDRYLTRPSIEYYKSGRRKNVAGETFDADILERPKVEAYDVHLLNVDENYCVSGYLKNVSSYPAHVTVESHLLNVNHDQIASNSAQQSMTHRLLPGQFGVFRVDFTRKQEDREMAFDPEINTSSVFEGDPESAQVIISTVVSDVTPYINTSVSSIQEGDVLKGDVVNTGSKIVSVPQILTVEDLEEGGVWVDVHYLPKGVSPLKKRSFSIDSPDRKRVDRSQELPSHMISINGARPTYSSSSVPHFPKAWLQSFVSEANE